MMHYTNILIIKADVIIFRNVTSYSVLKVSKMYNKTKYTEHITK